jgi:hypothetical protein
VCKPALYMKGEELTSLIFMLRFASAQSCAHRKLCLFVSAQAHRAALYVLVEPMRQLVIDPTCSQDCGANECAMRRISAMHAKQIIRSEMSSVAWMRWDGQSPFFVPASVITYAHRPLHLQLGMQTAAVRVLLESTLQLKVDVILAA